MGQKSGPSIGRSPGLAVLGRVERAAEGVHSSGIDRLSQPDRVVASRARCRYRQARH